MAVPIDLVPRVADLLVGFTVSGEAPSTPEPIVDDAASGAFPNGWTDDLVRRAYEESADPMRRLLLFLAENPEREVTSDDIAEGIEAKRGWNTVAGMLGAFGRRSSSRYKRPGPMWAFRWDAEGKGQLKMPAAVADVIKSAAGK